MTIVITPDTAKVLLGETRQFTADYFENSLFRLKKRSIAVLQGEIGTRTFAGDRIRQAVGVDIPTEVVTRDA